MPTPTPRAHRYLVGLGSNLGDRAVYLARAEAGIARDLGPIAARSRAYETAPVGAADQLFLNAALVCESDLEPEQALAALLAVEAELGRVRQEKWGNRVIDLDVLLWQPAADRAAGTGATRAYRSDALIVPHPYLLERPFALVPAAEAAPDWRHPGTGLTLAAEVLARGYRL